MVEIFIVEFVEFKGPESPDFDNDTASVAVVVVVIEELEDGNFTSCFVELLLGLVTIDIFLALIALI